MTEDLFQKFSSSTKGLDPEEARRRLREYGPNVYARRKRFQLLKELLPNFVNPLNCVLALICGVSYFAGERINAVLVFAMIGISSLLSFFQEHRSIREARKLSEALKVRVAVLRGGSETEVPSNELVPGDVVVLRAGDLVTADLSVLTSKDLFVNEAALTGESLPVEKHAAERSSAERETKVFAGSSVVSGVANAIVTATGSRTEFGELAAKLSEAPVPTAFDKGIQRFVWLMIGFMLFLTVLIFTVNVLMRGKPVEALLFSLAVAVGLTPEMLPVVIAITLSAGAIVMSKGKVIVKHLNAIQNLGSMDVLCSDKTGTLTENRIILEKHCDIFGEESEEVLKLAYLNSYFQTGMKNLLDEAVLKHEVFDARDLRKVDEIPFDFERRMMSVVLETGGVHRLITKGAAESVFKHSSQYEAKGKVFDLDSAVLDDLKKEYEKLNAEGFRVLAVASKDFREKKSVYTKQDEEAMVLKGYLAFLDPPKPDAKEIIGRIEKLGVRFMVLTGDDELITKKICNEVGLGEVRVVTGKEFESAGEKDALELVDRESIFARLNPMQKEKIVGLLRRKNHTVGYLGDGINDAPSLKAADIGISVDGAVDVAKESADIILLEKSLLVLERGILEGRKVSGNVMKYLKMGASSNLGNMISMTAASFFLPFLPMTPVQILLNNLLYDLSQVSIPTDKVDKDFTVKPRPWNLEGLKRFMIIFGALSSAFDFLTFWIMLSVLKFSEEAFHTGWFLESLATQTLVIYVVRSGKIPFIQTRPSGALMFTTIVILTAGFAMTVLPFSGHLGFEKLPGAYYGILLLIIAGYLLIVEAAKRIYARKYAYD